MKISFQLNIFPSNRSFFLNRFERIRLQYPRQISRFSTLRKGKYTIEFRVGGNLFKLRVCSRDTGHSLESKLFLPGSRANSILPINKDISSSSSSSPWKYFNPRGLAERKAIGSSAGHPRSEKRGKRRTSWMRVARFLHVRANFVPGSTIKPNPWKLCSVSPEFAKSFSFPRPCESIIPRDTSFVRKSPLIVFRFFIHQRACTRVTFRPR